MGGLWRAGRSCVIIFHPVLQSERQFRDEIIAPEIPSFIFHRFTVNPDEKPFYLQIVKYGEVGGEVIVAEHSIDFYPSFLRSLQPIREEFMEEMAGIAMRADISAGYQQLNSDTNRFAQQSFILRFISVEVGEVDIG